MLKIANIYPVSVSLINNNIEYEPGVLQGGGETEAFDFSQVLSDEGNLVTYLTGAFPGQSLTDLKVSDELTIKYYNLRFHNNFVLTHSIKMFIDLLFGDYDVIHSHQIPIMFSVLGGLAARLSHKKFVITFCGKLANTKIEKILFYLSSKLAHKIVIQNPYVAEVVERSYNKYKLITIPYYINSGTVMPADIKRVRELYKLPDKKTILTLCRLLPAKGVDIVIEAFKRISTQTDAMLVIGGTGPEEAKLKQMVKDYKLTDRVIFTGFVPSKDLFPLYASAYTFVLASTYHYADGKPIPGMCETFALVLGEAMTCNTPVIASAVGGIPYWITDGYNGMLFKERDSSELAQKILTILKDDKLKYTLKTNARNDLKTKYSRSVIIKQFERLYSLKNT